MKLFEQNAVQRSVHSIAIDSWQPEGTLTGFRKQVKFKDIHLKIIFVGNSISKFQQILN